MAKYDLYKVKPEDIDISKVSVHSNRDMLPWERETIILMNDDSQNAEITTWQVVWTKHLMNHPFCTIEYVWMSDDYTIVGLDGLMPKTSIRTTLNPRQRFDKL
jgi:hypothetical protein